jgi:stress-induced morphogen
MAIHITRGQADDVLNEIVQALGPYEADHPAAQIDLYRRNNVSVRVRIVDPDLAGLSLPQRHDLAWRYLDALSDEAQADISTLLLLAPAEVPESFGNMEFENPVPSVLL